MGNPLYASALNLANHTGESWNKNIKGGILASLVQGVPELKVGQTDHFTFTGTPKAELVGEGADKSSEDGTPTKKTVNTYKVQITYRFSHELMWEDEDYQAGVVDGLVENVATAISRALDLVAIHGVNPKTGTVSGSVQDYFNKSANGVTTIDATADPVDDIDSAAEALQTEGYVATGIALDPVFAGQLARVKDADGRQMYPELGLGFAVDNFQGLPAASSDTVSGRQELAAADARTQAIMGDFNAFKWGIARELPLELIEFGDPDGAGDLKRTNEVAIRAEAVFGFAIFDGKAFSVIATPAA